MSRPEYCSMILEKLPESKVLFNKTVISVSTLEDEDDTTETKAAQQEPGEARGVTVECADGTMYHGQLLVGDINSDVERKQLYVSEPQRHETTNAATSSKKDMPVREIHYHVSGITEAVDPQRIPLLKEDTTQLRLVLDNKNSLSVCSFYFFGNAFVPPMHRGYFCPTQPKTLTPPSPVVVGCNLGRPQDRMAGYKARCLL